MTREPARSRIRPHPFVVDDELGVDWFGRRTCRTCRVVGEPGDVHHPYDAAPWRPDPAEAAALAARILGERDELEEAC